MMEDRGSRIVKGRGGRGKFKPAEEFIWVPARATDWGEPHSQRSHSKNSRSRLKFTHKITKITPSRGQKPSDGIPDCKLYFLRIALTFKERAGKGGCRGVENKAFKEESRYCQPSRKC
jgi:hypothetical protein